MSDANTLFLCHFDKGLEADVAVGNKVPVSGSAPIVPDGKFGSAYQASVSQSAVLYYSAVKNINPVQGTIEFWYKPNFSLNNPQLEVYTYRLFASSDWEREEGVAFGVNYYSKKNKYQPWFHVWGKKLNPISYGVETIMDLEKEQWYHIAVCWDEKNMMLFLNGQCLGVKERRGTMSFGETFQLGGDNDTHGYADGLIDEFRISDRVRYAAPAGTVQIDFPQRRGTGTVLGYHETADNIILFQVESDCQIDVTLRPQIFPVTAGTEYYIANSYDDPQLVTAVKDGEISFRLNAPRNANIIVERTKGPNLIANSSFEAGDKTGADGWVAVSSGERDDYVESHFQFSDGNYDFADGTWSCAEVEKAAENAVVASTDYKRNGRRSILIRKNTSTGYALVRTGEGIPVTPGAEYLLDGYYRMEDVHFGGVIHFGVWLIEAGTALPTSREAVMDALCCTQGRAIVESSLNPLIPVGDRPWRRSFLRFKVPPDMVKPQAVVFMIARGSPFSIWWDDVSLRLKPPVETQGGRPASPQQIQPLYGPDEVAEVMKEKMPVALSTVKTPGRSGLLDNGQPCPLFGYTGMTWQWPLYSPGHSDFTKAGVKLHWLPVHMGGCKDSSFNVNYYGKPTWLAEDRYDFTGLDERLTRLLGYDPDARVMLYLSVDPYPEFGEKHPDSIWRTANGKGVIIRNGISQGSGYTLKPEEYWAVSYTDQVYRQQGCDALRALAEHLKKSDLGKAVAGIHMTRGNDGQWYGYVWEEWDYSAGNLAAFRDWLRRLYNNNVSTLREAWADPNVTFDSAVFPDREKENYFFLMSRGSDRRVMEATEFQSQGAAETINLFARTFKEAMGRPVLTSVYYSDFMHGHGTNHCALQTLLNQPDLDGMVSVPEYCLFRSVGRPGCMNSLTSSRRLHSKYYLIELDHRSDYSALEERLREAYGVPRGEEGLANQVRRDLGMSLCQGEGAWVYGLGGNNWWSEKGIATVAEAYKAAQFSATHPLPSDTGQIAVFGDENVPAFISNKNNYRFYVAVTGHYSARYALNLSGLSWDGYLLSDLENPVRPKYKINLFLSAVSITPEQIAWIEKNLQKDGNVLVFVHAAGYGWSDGFSRNIKRLTGMEIKEGSEQSYRFNSLNNLYEQARGPRFFVDDKTATTIAFHAGTTESAVAVKHFPRWTSVYIALPGGFTPTMMRKIADLAGIVPVGPEGDATYAGNGFLVIHSRTAGEKTLRWTGPSNLIDITTGTMVARNTEKYTFSMPALTTKWFRRIPITTEKQ